MQNGGKCQISDICPRSAPCISGPVSSMLEEMRKGAEEDAGRVSRHAVQPDGPREGRLDLQYEGSAVTGSLELMGRRNPVHGVRSEDGHLCLSHAIRTAVSTLFCETALELHGERLTGVTTADVCRMRWEGSRISPEP